MIMGAGQGFDCLTVRAEPANKNGYSEITSVVNTLAIDDFQDEMPCPKGSILIKDAYLRDFDVNQETEPQQEDEDETMFGNLQYVKTLAYNDVEVSLVSYDTAVHITAFHTEKGVRTLLGNKLFDTSGDSWESTVEGDVVVQAFNNIGSYEDASRFISNFAMDEETLKKLKEGLVSEDTSITFVENAWELKENEDGQEEGE